VRLGEVMADLGMSALLRLRQREGQVLYQPCSQFSVCRQAGRDALAPLAVMHAHRQLLREQFVELDALPGRMAAVFQRARGDVG